jgi:hypothetical protein
VESSTGNSGTPSTAEEIAEKIASEDLFGEDFGEKENSESIDLGSPCESTVNLYGFSIDVFDIIGAGVDIGIYHDRVNNEIGIYAGIEAGPGVDNGLSGEAGFVDSVGALNGIYGVAELGALGTSANFSWSLRDGQTSTTGNIGFDNAGAPQGHMGVGYGRSIHLFSW